MLRSKELPDTVWHSELKAPAAQIPQNQTKLKSTQRGGDGVPISDRSFAHPIESSFPLTP